MEKWSRIKYQPNRPLYEDKYVTCSKEHIALSKEAATEGMILLKNDGTLPLAKGAKLALFGKGSFDYVKGGGGSGDVYTKYVRNLYEGLKELGLVEIYEPLSDFYRANVEKQYSEGAAPGMTVEPAICDSLCDDAKANADVALVVISRFSGEGWDRSSVDFEGLEFNPWETETSMPKIAGEIFPDGDFYLTAAEKEMISKVTARFDKVVAVLNVGGIIDASWVKNDDKINACLHMGQGGMEGGLAAAELLCGLKNPSGKLTDSYAKTLEEYPSTEGFLDSPWYVDYKEDIFVGYRYFETFNKEVVYPFGFGMSYTSFDIEPVIIEELEGDKISVIVRVTNTGKVAGKEVVQVYYGAPQGLLGKPAKELAGFAKTKELAPGESQTVDITFAKAAMASFDDLGKIAKSAYVLEAGDYKIYVGNSVVDVELVAEINVPENTVTEQLTSKCAPTELSKRLLADGTYEALPQGTPNDKDACIFEKMVPGTEEAIIPKERARDAYLMLNPYKNDAKPFSDVAEGKMTLDEFIAQIETDDLIELLGGQRNLGVANTWGFGNLMEYGIPNIMTADGPAGVRIHECCGVPTTAWPCATVLACTWNTELVERVGRAGGEELKENNLAVWLTPACNIHRNPLCGRNFEYYSEDPVVAGKMGSAMVRGIQSNNVGCSVKHFAVNNKETNRKHLDSRLSERALREIYLKQFEIIVKEAKPWTIMSSYNVINGHRASENKDLLEGILRDEWGFEGMVTSDWWTRGEHYKEILAGNDVKMAVGYPDRVKKAMEMGALDRSDLEHCARRVLELILKFD